MIELGVFDDWSVELLDGALVEKMSKSELHVFLVHLLFQTLTSFCSGSLLVRKEDPITIGNSEPEPNISVVRGSLADFRRRKPTTAEFVIEVAISSLAIDRAKAADYAWAGISEFWLIRPEDGVTEVCRHPADGEFSEKMDVPAETSIESSALPGFSFNLADAIHE